MAFPERLEDLHPVSDNHFWDAKPFDKFLLPYYMHTHPYFGLEVIE